MPKKKLNQSPRLEDYLNTYDSKALKGAIHELQNSMAWDLLKSYLHVRQRWFEVAALDLIRHNGHEQEAAHASGYAQANQELIESVIPELLQRISGTPEVVNPGVPEVELQDHVSEV